MVTLSDVNSFVALCIAAVSFLYLLLYTRRMNLDTIYMSMKDWIKEDAKNALNDADTQKLLYSLGALLGNGIKTGIGLQKSGGKMQMQDLIMQAIAAFMPQIAQGAGQALNPFQQK